MKHLLSALVIIIMICISANGEEITFSFRGTIHELDGEYSFLTGHLFDITFSFDSTTDDADPDDPESGKYIGAIKSGILTVFTGDESWKWVVQPDGPQNIIEVKNLDTADSYIAGASVSGPAVGWEIPASFIIELIDKDATALGNDELPSSLEILSFDYQRVAKFTFVGAGKYIYSTLGVITSGNAPVPYPDTGGDGFPNDVVAIPE